MDKYLSKKNNCLILDSNQESWPKNSSLYYMGYWCLEKIESSFKNRDKFEVVNSAGKESLAINNQMNEIFRVYNILILDLSNYLNKFHKKDYSKKFWEIVIGPWLKIFLGIVSERYHGLNDAFSKFDINQIILADYEHEDFFVENVGDLEEKASKNLNGFNNILYTKIFEILNFNCQNIKIKGKKEKEKNLKKKISLKKKFINSLSIFNLFSKKVNYFIYSSGLKFKEDLILKFYLKQFPFIFLEPTYSKKKIDINVRKKIDFKKNKIQQTNFEKIARSLISSLLPTDCLENFQTLEQKLESLKWPKNPKVIFTSVGYHNDEIFKLYTANHAEKGSTYIVGQHGANYFTNKNTVIEPGFDQSDKFFSWGNIKKDKCESLFNIKNISLSKSNTRGNKVFFFMPKMSNIRKRPWDDYGQMIKENISIEKILFNLRKEIKNSCILKLHFNDYDSGQLENKILKEIIFYRQIYSIDRTSKNKEIFKKSKLIVNSGDGTSFLETITANIPTVAFLSNFNWMTEEAKQDYEKLIEAKIIFLNEEKMSNHINNIFQDIGNWWQNEKIEKIKNEFKKKYTLSPPNNSLKILSKKILEN